VLERGARHGKLQLMNTPRAEAEAFQATVHGAMLSARPMAIRKYSAP
jgi:TetR/AcrR family transcriptional repressor of nem operon